MKLSTWIMIAGGVVIAADAFSGFQIAQGKDISWYTPLGKLESALPMGSHLGVVLVIGGAALRFGLGK